MAIIEKIINVSDLKEEQWDSLCGLLIRHGIITTDKAIAFLAEDSEEEIELEVEYEGTIVPYSPATLECPSEGGYCEDDAVTIPTEDKAMRARGEKYSAIARRISSHSYKNQEQRRKADRLKRRLKFKANHYLFCDITEYIEQSTLEEWSQEAYERYQD